jgi:hypothetical protein
MIRDQDTTLRQDYARFCSVFGEAFPGEAPPPFDDWYRRLVRIEAALKAVREAALTDLSTHTPNGYDPRWVEAINGVLEDRDSDIRIVDLDDDFWNEFIGPMVDAIEDGEWPETEDSKETEED